MTVNHWSWTSKIWYKDKPGTHQHITNARLYVNNCKSGYDV